MPEREETGACGEQHRLALASGSACWAAHLLWLLPFCLTLASHQSVCGSRSCSRCVQSTPVRKQSSRHFSRCNCSCSACHSLPALPPSCSRSNGTFYPCT